MTLEIKIFNSLIRKVGYMSHSFITGNREGDHNKDR